MRDLRKYAQQTNLRLFAFGILLIILIGIGLIYLFYGQSAALFGLLCMGIGLVPLILIWLALSILEWISKRAYK